MYLEAKSILNIHAQCEKEIEVNNDGSGFLRVIPIIGGNFDGEFTGVVIQGGADWNTTSDSGVSHVFAKYLLLADNGDYITIENEGKINGNNCDQRIKTALRFQVNKDSPYAYLNHGVYVGELNAGITEGHVEISIYRLM